MKKVISLLLIMILFLSGCSGTQKDSLANISWNFSRIVDTQTGVTVFSSEKENSKYNTAKVTDLSCMADDNKITIKDNATGNEWTLDYSKNTTAKTNNTEGVIYDISYTSEEKTLTGYATTGLANLNDYLIITIGGYELHFIEQTQLI